ncbi:MAG: DUF3450 domain-containing protein [Pseudomonadales bacterium]|nr:DUF3450 domain-containing protein [Pseudomonadales bacterium]MCP5184900.1 DUF3450 domain-containing protein [Pseudomonadales bacterium]
MSKHIRNLAQAIALGLCLVGVGAVNAATLNDIFAVTKSINDEAKRSQAKIDALTEETRGLLNDYKTVLKEIEGLRVYNRQLDKQIANQNAEMAEINDSIDKVTLIERQITPFMLRMVDGLEQFVSLDMPFWMNERANRIAELRNNLDRADVAVSEKFNQVMRAFQIENEYGRTMDSYSETINIDGTERKVDILRVGRVVLAYQSLDGEETGMWNKQDKKWEPISDDFSDSVRRGIKMARKQLAVDLLALPVTGPEAAAK